MTQWKHAQEYLELAFLLDKFFPGYVDAYFGPIEIKEAVAAQPKPELGALADKAEHIIESTRQDETLSDARREYLIAQVVAMQTTIQILQGQQFDIIEETRRFFGVSPEWIEESVFEQTHATLNELLPGKETLREKVDRFREQTVIPKEKLQSLIDNLSNSLQSSVRSFIPLPETEQCEYVLVNEKPWSGYNWYLGDYRSRVEINTDLPIRIMELPTYIAHEAYPGHHTDSVIKEHILYKQNGFLESTVFPYNTPENIIAEGIGENSLEVAASPEHIISFYQYILDQLEVKDWDGEIIYQIWKAWKKMQLMNINLVLLLHQKGASDQELIDYQVEYRLSTEERAKKSLEFLKDPFMRSYACLYPMGEQLVHDYIYAQSDPKAALYSLMKEQITTSALLR